MAQLWAVKAKLTKANAWMPAECLVLLDGDPAKGILIGCGWTTGCSFEKASKKEGSWPKERLEKYLGKIARSWQADYGRGWKLEIREI